MSIHGADIGRKLTLEEYDLLKARGFSWVGRYFDGTKGASAKSLSGDEVAAAHSRGIAILPVFEVGGGQFDLATGIQHGQLARADALAAGYPLGLPIPTAVDKDVPPDQALLDYFNGYYQGLDGAYLEGMYGSDRCVEFARLNWPGTGFFWQTYAWSAGVVFPAADAFQYANGVTIRPGLEVDLNIARAPIPWRIA